jgi:predicted CoA-binding protein
MGAHQALVDDFLAQKRIAVAGVSRSGDATGNIIYKKFKDNGYEVFALNPKAEIVEGDRAYPSLKDIPGGVDGVVIITLPKDTEQIVHDAAEAGVKRVWMHNNTFTPSCGSEQATAYCKEHGIAVIDVGCPMMFLDADFPHKCMKWWLRGFGKMPK